MADAGWKTGVEMEKANGRELKGREEEEGKSDASECERILMSPKGGMNRRILKNHHLKQIYQ
jgi:hypothetical protein